MSNNTPASQRFPLRIERELEANLHRIRLPLSAQLLWDGVLTSSERVALGNDLGQAYRQGGTVGMWQRVHRVSHLRAIIDVAYELSFIDRRMRRELLRQTKELSEEHEDALQLALESADLVLTDRPRAAYWHGNLIPIEWQRQLAMWGFLWELCYRAKSRRGVDHTDFSDRYKPGYPAKMKSRLNNDPHFPVSLGDLIQSAGGNSQKLDLAPERIRILKTEIREYCREELGRADA